MVKKIFIISSILFVIGLALWGIYFFSFRAPQNDTEVKTADENTPAENKEQPVATQKKPRIYAVSQSAVIAPTLTEDKENLKYYLKDTGQAYQVDFDGIGQVVISSKEISGLKSAVWSPDKTKSVLHIDNNEDDYFMYANYSTLGQIQLKENLDTVVWQNDSKIIYKFYDPAAQERTLNIADPDGQNWKEIADLDFRSMKIAPIPRTGLVSFWNAPDSYAETKMESIGVVGGEKKLLIGGKFGADFLWSPDGNSLLVSHAAERKGNRMQLAVTNSQGGEYKGLNIPTLISKCVWSDDNKTVYYALPGSIPETAVMPNELLEGKFFSNDTFWKVDVESGENTRLVDLDQMGGAYDASDLFLNSDESMLFFINRKDGRLYRIDL